jgi:hypothetical protein
LLERDFQSITDRPVKSGSTIKGSIEKDASTVIGMTISEPDYNSPLGVALKRVEWVLEGDELLRKVWDVLDTDGNYEPEEQIIGTSIEEVGLEFLFYSSDSGVEKNEKLNGNYPDGIKVSIRLESGDEYSRLFEVAKPLR